MFNIGGQEVLVIALIALIVVGPEQLPSVLRKLGKQAAQLRSMTQSVRDEFMSGVEEVNPANWLEDDSDVPKNPTSLKELEEQMDSAEQQAEEEALGKQEAAEQQARFEAKAEDSMLSKSTESKSADPLSESSDKPSGTSSVDEIDNKDVS